MLLTALLLTAPLLTAVLLTAPLLTAPLLTAPLLTAPLLTAPSLTAVGDEVSHRMLIAGVGNIFLGDDGFGAEVARRLARAGLPDLVRVADYGISGMHLAYDMADGYDTTILVDATARGGEPGTVYVIEPDQGAPAAAAGPAGPAQPRRQSAASSTRTVCSPTSCSGWSRCSAPSQAGCLWSAASRPASNTGSG